VLEVLVGGKKGPEVLETKQSLKHTIHVASVPQVVEPSLGGLMRVLQLVLFIALAVEGFLAGFVMESLVIDSTSVAAVVNLVANAADNKWLLLHTLLTVSLGLPFLFFRSEGFSYFDDQGVGWLYVLVNIILFVPF
jgi:hypothetical protein